MVIYKTTNTLNGKYYIGKDRHNNPNYIGSGKIFLKALKKYDRCLWVKTVIDTAETDDEAYFKEKFWIKFYDSTNRDKGYNLSVGGKNPVLFGENNPYYGKCPTDEARKRHGEIMRGRKITEEHKINISKGLKGRIKSDVERENISRGLKGKLKSEEHKNNMRHPHRKGYKQTAEHTRNILAAKARKKLLKGLENG